MEVEKTREFLRWFDGLKDLHARPRIQTRIYRLIDGNAGDCKAIGEGVLELRIHYGPGYRVYFTRRGEQWMILLAGGDKSSQISDIKLALRLARKL